MTTFKGRKTGFNPTGSNDCCPNMTGPPSAEFKGRSGFPEGKMSARHPGAVANVSGSNRRVAKSAHGDGGGMATNIKTRTAFGGGMKKGK